MAYRNCFSHWESLVLAACLLAMPELAFSAPPDVVTGVSAAPGDGKVVVSWNASKGASSYEVQFSPGTKIDPATPGTVHSATDACAVDGLANDEQYTFSVIALAENGDASLASTPITVTPRVGAKRLEVFPKVLTIPIGENNDYEIINIDPAACEGDEAKSVGPASDASALQQYPTPSGLPAAQRYSYVIFDAECGGKNISWTELYKAGFLVSACKYGETDSSLLPAFLIGKKGKAGGTDKDKVGEIKYAVSVKAIRYVTKASPGDVVEIKCDITNTGEYDLSTASKKSYFHYNPYIELYNDFGTVGFPGLHFGLANSYSFDPWSGELTVDPVMAAFGWRLFLWPDKLPSMYLGYSFGAFATITANSSTQSASDVTQVTFCPLIIDVNNIVSFGLGNVYNWTTRAWSETILLSVDSGLLNAIKGKN